ncbi:NAD(P)/FAD-dependent oxidoreductase [Helicobacter sp.]|uniref:NAD(P)/FAD-dependent oxidoreductase n=1 Tax=Helicobacter sp. TaxID=218 RepID=UPI0025BC9DD1|nr:NAD(P)/FAD-dependent oxidoreductase [Helicobacter sp.]MCI5969379.1 NAD(P)/FAD-dependent oxidoreductase [Helicobacter sp.]MDY2585634.1 NAD(P)/FAD-dependent oxidoreductase [Helicobacter sp.]
MKNVVLLGGGYANLSFIKNLKEENFKEFNFTLISEETSHYTSVLLHEVVSKAQNITIEYQDILPKAVHFVQDSIVEIQEKQVLGKNGIYSYDILIVGLGFTSDDFGIPGVKEYAHSMKNFKNCLEIHKMIAEKTNHKSCEVVVCGGGFSGIELLGNLAQDAKNIKLKCIEAMPMILPMFDKELALHAKTYLEKLGVTFYLGSKILECQDKTLIIEKDGQQEKITADLILWTAGVKGNEVIENSSFLKSQRSKIEVDAFLKPIEQERANIFVLGDCAALKDPNTGRFFPPTAQLANQQGIYLAKNFNTSSPAPFNYLPRATICSLGNNYAIGLIGKTQIKGRIAAYIKMLVEFKWILQLKGFKALLG